MKLLDRALEKTIEASKTFKSLAESVKSLASSLAMIAHNQAVHHQMISQMWQQQRFLMMKLQGSSLNMEMPAIKHDDDSKKPGAGKPN